MFLLQHKKIQKKNGVTGYGLAPYCKIRPKRSMCIPPPYLHAALIYIRYVIRKKRGTVLIHSFVFSRMRFFHVLSVVCVGCAVYYNALPNDFAFDGMGV